MKGTLTSKIRQVSYGVTMVATRRRGAELVRDLHEAVLAEVERCGYAGTTYDRVARRAGTSKPVLYRRWPTKAQMVLDALAATTPIGAVSPDTGSLAGDLKTLLATMRSSVDVPGRRTVLSLLAEPETGTGSTVRELLFDKGADALQPIVERARRRGELGDSSLPSAFVVLPLDLARHELLVDGALSDESIDMIVDEIALPLLTSRSRSGRGSPG